MSEMATDLARWRTAVAGVLAKSSRKDPADLGSEPERLLDSPTYDGFRSGPSTRGSTRCPNRRFPASGRSSAVGMPCGT